MPAEVFGGYELMAGDWLVGWTCTWGDWCAWRRHSSIALAEGEAVDEVDRRLAVEDALDAAGVAFDLAVRA